MKVVGITGRSGCGKSSATNFLREKGYPCIDADLVAREVLLPGSPCIAQLQQVFGADIADENGTVRCDALILVTAPYETSVARICARDGIAPEMARRRLDAQTPLETLRAAATAELVNDSTPDALREKLRSVLNGLEKEGTCQKPKSEKEAF